MQAGSVYETNCINSKVHSSKRLLRDLFREIIQFIKKLVVFKVSNSLKVSISMLRQVFFEAIRLINYLESSQTFLA